MIFFSGIDKTSEKMLFDKFTEKYGEPDNSQEYRQNLDEETFESGLIFCRTISDELSISISFQDYIEKETNLIFYHSNVYTYQNPIISKQIGIEIAKKNIDGIVF